MTGVTMFVLAVTVQAAAALLTGIAVGRSTLVDKTVRLATTFTTVSGVLQIVVFFLTTKSFTNADLPSLVIGNVLLVTSILLLLSLAAQLFVRRGLDNGPTRIFLLLCFAALICQGVTLLLFAALSGW